MKMKLLAMMLLAGGSMFAQTRFSIGLGFAGQGAGFYQAPPAYAMSIPPSPGPGFMWVEGYWSQNYGRQFWVPGFWNRQPFRTGYVAPRANFRFSQDRNRNFDQNRGNNNRYNGRDNRQGNGFRSR